MDNSTRESFVEKLKNVDKPTPNWFKILSLVEKGDLYIVGYGGMGSLITLKANSDYVEIINYLIENKNLIKNKKEEYLYELNSMVYWYEYRN